MTATVEEAAKAATTKMQDAYTAALENAFHHGFWWAVGDYEQMKPEMSPEASNRLSTVLENGFEGFKAANLTPAHDPYYVLEQTKRALAGADELNRQRSDEIARLRARVADQEGAIRELLRTTAAYQLELDKRKPTKRVRHIQRLSEYEVLGEAELQLSAGLAYALVEGDKIVVYRNVDTGNLWARFPAEFNDGRFEEIT